MSCVPSVLLTGLDNTPAGLFSSVYSASLSPGLSAKFVFSLCLILNSFLRQVLCCSSYSLCVVA